MPRASWKGFLRLSLVSCPVYLSPATSRTKAIRLNQVWVPRTRPGEPAEAEEDEEPAQISGGRGANQTAAEQTAEGRGAKPAEPAPRLVKAAQRRRRAVLESRGLKDPPTSAASLSPSRRKS